jgi:uncharacterized membrane protein YczE
MFLLKDIRPANRYRLGVLLVGFLVVQTFLPLLSHQPQWLASALLWMTLGGIVVGISTVAWLRPEMTVSVNQLRFLVMAAVLGLPMGLVLYMYGPQSANTAV